MAATSLKKGLVSTTVDLGVWWSTLPLWLDCSMGLTVRGEYKFGPSGCVRQLSQRIGPSLMHAPAEPM